MSGLRVCGCLNWSVHCQEVQSCDLRQKAPLADPFFKGGLVCAKLAPQGITKRHSFLESVRTVGDWEVHSCQGCHQDVYAQASDRSLLLSANLESDIKRIEAMRASADYSPCFHVLLPPVADNEGGAANVAPGVTEEEALVARLHVQQLAAQFLQNELEAMEARLRLYQEQQAQALERLRLRTARDQDALWHIIVSKSGGQEQVSAGRVTSVKQRPMAPQMSDVKCRVAAQLEGEMFQLDGFEEDEAAFPSSEEEHSDGVADHSQNAMFWLWVLQMTATAVAAVPSMSLCDTVPTRFRWTCPGGGLVMMTTSLLWSTTGLVPTSKPWLAVCVMAQKCLVTCPDLG
ncbi:uncharacterized protein LOC119169213 isoform X2 [Rhipicephalus microplus]|uniref:uncharacterized protein LOC119169213 isoform X2 n=1 Tax=Rhipicephalus microplus TaxID=6941 RepID=UPI0018875715|nr:uncharacterized protein LOC119169213 isoform X1 [Rhipicephalus microplus]